MSATLTSHPLRVRIDDLPDLVGRQLDRSTPILVSQDRINEFGNATDDRQWIHTDAARAADGPFGTTIAHGFLTLALGPAFLWDVLDVHDAGQVVNYGLNKVRFPSPVPSGSELACDARIDSVDAIPGGYQVTIAATFTVVGHAKPACVAEVLLRYYRGNG